MQNLKKILPVLILLIAVASCIENGEKKINHNDINTIHQEEDSVINKELEDSIQYIVDPNEKEIISVPDTLYLGDTLKIKFKTPHSNDIGIYTPYDENYFFLSLDSTIIPSYENFSQLSLLEIITDKAKSIPYVYGITEKELIFKKPGLYKIFLSKNLETEGVPVEMEEILYINSIRKK